MGINIQRKDAKMQSRKKKVEFIFDERSLQSAEQFRRDMEIQGWRLTEVKTLKGTFLIPEIPSPWRLGSSAPLR